MSADQHVTESAGAYVLGALTLEEVRELEAHLQNCDACRDDIRSLKEVAGVLPLTAPAVQPASNLKLKILDAARSEEPAKQLLRRAAQRAAGASPRADLWHRPVPFWAGVAGWVGVAAACITMGIFIGVANERQRMLAAMPQPQTVGRVVAESNLAAKAVAPANDQVIPVTVSRLQSEAIALLDQAQVFDLSVHHGGDRIPAKIMQMPNQNHATLVTDMPAAPAGQVYRVWLIRKGKMHLGDVVGQGKMVKTTIPMKVESGDVIAFSMAAVGDFALPSHFVMQQTL
jgi:anti-sigma factor RsiW